MTTNSPWVARLDGYRRTSRAPRFGRLSLACMAVAASLLAAGEANASCSDPRAMRSMQPRVTALAPADSGAFRPGPAEKNIVGTWLVSYALGGVPNGQAYIQWHSDGTEWENINFPIEGGNLCLGSWKALDIDHVMRNHFGWLYTNGVLTGHFNETETAEVRHDGTYTGTTHTRVYDLFGNLQVEFSGTSSAIRIAP
jgi:hypothetical protein